MRELDQPGALEHRPDGGGAIARLPYHPPILRSHGELRDVTAQKSAEVKHSDVALKENIVAIAWG